MVRKTISLGVALAALALLAVNAHAAGKPTGTEFKDGWNTYATAKVGDWVEYQITDTVSRRIEVKVVKDDKITVAESVTSDGKAGEPKEKKPADWWSMKMQANIPTNMNVDWSTKEITHGGVTLKCDVASWMNGALSNEVYFCKDVRCGGYVKMVMGGKTGVWLKNYGDATKKEGYLKSAENPDAGKGPTLPPFYNSAGNTAVFKTGENYMRRQTDDFDGKAVTFTDTPCDKDGKPLPDAKAVSTTWSDADWAKAYPKPSAKDQKVKVAAGEYSCALYESTEGGKTTKDWLSAEGVLVKREVKEGDKITVTELVSVRFK